MDAEHLSRIGRLQAAMAKADIDAAFLYTPVNRLYFTGLQTSNGLLVVERQGTPIFYTDFRYLEVAHRVLTGVEIRKFKLDKEQLADYAAMGANWKQVGYESDLSVAQFLPLQETFAKAKMVSVTKHIGDIRAVKCAAEIDAIRRSAAANDALLGDLLKRFRPGMSELEMLRQFRIAEAERGLTESFDPILCAGVNAVECHHQPDGSILAPQSELLIDMGVKVDNYCSDMTRTLFFGDPTPRFKEIFGIVLEANAAVRAAIKPGMRCCDADKIARDIIAKAGYGDYFGHSLGHSVGLEIHEQPNLSFRCETVLQPGMVVTDEPGIYIPGDCEVLSHTPHEIILPC